MKARTEAKQAGRNGNRSNGEAPKASTGNVTVVPVDYTSTIQRAKDYFAADDAKRLADNAKYVANRAPIANRLALSLKAWLHATGAAKADKTVKADFLTYQAWVAKRSPVGPDGSPMLLVNERLTGRCEALGLPTHVRKTYRSDVAIGTDERNGLIRDLIAKAESELAKSNG